MPSRPIAGLLATVLCLLLAVAPAGALSAADLSVALPQESVLDRSDVLSRAASAEISRALEQLDQQGIEARLITVPRLDYGLGLQELGEQLLGEWQGDSPDRPLLLLLIDTQTNGAAVVAGRELSEQLGPELLRSTARGTLGQPLRDGGRYRQASLDAIQRLAAVLQGEDDPGAPVTADVVKPRTNVPSQEETASSNAWLWVTVLLVVGTIVPMLTWWVFSR